MFIWSRDAHAAKVAAVRRDGVIHGGLHVLVLVSFAVLILSFVIDNGGPTHLVASGLFIALAVYAAIYTIIAGSNRKKYNQLVAKGDIVVVDDQTNAFGELALKLIDAEATRKRSWLQDRLIELNDAGKVEGADPGAIAAMVQTFIAELNSMVYKPATRTDDQPPQQ